MLKTILAVFLISISGCVAQPQKYQAVEVVTEPTPVCDSKKSCEIMWLDAQEAIQLATDMRIRLLTDTRIETYAPTDYSHTGGVVMKYPIADNKYEIRVQIECYRGRNCDNLRAIETNLFNLHLKRPPSRNTHKQTNQTSSLRWAFFSPKGKQNE